MTESDEKICLKPSSGCFENVVGIPPMHIWGDSNAKQQCHGGRNPSHVHKRHWSVEGIPFIYTESVKPFNTNDRYHYAKIADDHYSDCK